MTVRKTPLFVGGIEGYEWGKSYHQDSKIYSVDAVACCLNTKCCCSPFYLIEGDTNENNRKDPDI